MQKTVCALIACGASITYADPLTVEIKPATSTWHQKKPVDVTLKVTNTSKLDVTFMVMSCSWQDHWKANDHELGWTGPTCDENGPSSVTLAPGKAREWKLPMFATEKAKLGAHPLEMTFTPRNGTPAKSNLVTITVAR